VVPGTVAAVGGPSPPALAAPPRLPSPCRQSLLAAGNGPRGAFLSDEQALLSVERECLSHRLDRVQVRLHAAPPGSVSKATLARPPAPTHARSQREQATHTPTPLLCVDLSTHRARDLGLHHLRPRHRRLLHSSHRLGSLLVIDHAQPTVAAARSTPAVLPRPASACRHHSWHGWHHLSPRGVCTLNFLTRTGVI
jgi:hypothetical protein